MVQETDFGFCLDSGDGPDDQIRLPFQTALQNARVGRSQQEEWQEGPRGVVQSPIERPGILSYSLVTPSTPCTAPTTLAGLKGLVMYSSAPAI